MVLEAECPSVERWFRRLSPSTIIVNKVILSKFMDFLQNDPNKFSGFKPDDLVEYQKNAGNGELYDIVDELQEFVDSQKKLRYHSLRKYHSTVRSFFAHNRAELPKDVNYSPRSEVPQVRGSLEPEEIRDMVLASKPRYRAIILSLLQGGMGQEEWDYWNKNGWPSLKEQLEKKLCPVRVDLPGRKTMKHKRPYYTFLGRDAIEAIQDYIENHRPEKEDAIFYDQYGKPLSKSSVKDYWTRQTYRIGLVKPKRTQDIKEKARSRHGKSLHELRDTFRTLWSKSSAKYFIGEYFLGHDIDPLNYDKSFRDVEFYKKEYELVEPYLNIMSSDRPFGKVDESQLEHQENRIRELEDEVEILRSGHSSDVEVLRAEVSELKGMLKMLYDNLKLVEELKRT